MSPRLLGSERPLHELYDVALLDLDGVVYVGERPVAGAPEALAAARAAGLRLAFVTNNASRTATAVAERLSGMGVPATAEEVTTSAQAAARHLAEVEPEGAAVLVVGGAGLHEALTDRGLRPVSTAVDPETGEPVTAVVQGFAPEVGWAVLAEAAVALRAGARWVATNLDRTIPSERGPLPGNGSLVHVLTHAFGVEPSAATGKPDPTMHQESVDRSGARRPVVVGDRLDTDVEGAVRVGAPSLLVLSGVTDAAGLLGAGPGERPDHVARDVGGLLQPHPAVDWSEGVSRCTVGRWVAELVEGRVVLSSAAEGEAGPGERSDDDALDALRVVTPGVWRVVDAADGSGPTPAQLVQAGDDAAAAVLRELGLGDAR